MKKMISKGKRMVALFLCCAVCVTMFHITASAGCTVHNWEKVSILQRYEKVSSSVCRGYYKDRYTCKTCGRVEWSAEYHRDGPHGYGNYSATCNGTLQTIVQRCPYCQDWRTISRKCPAGPHTGNCPALPASIQPEIK